jgi:PIN domain nuclease of toxin-antitoxin system
MSLESLLDEVQSRFVVKAITSMACVKTLELPATYPKDPANRIIGAAAWVEGIPLVTANEKIRRTNAFKTI